MKRKLTKLDFLKPLSSNRDKRIDTFKADCFWFCVLTISIVGLLFVVGSNIE